MGWACGVCGWGGDRALLGKPEGRRLLGRPRRRWLDNIRTDIQEVGCGYVDWIGLVQDRDRWRTLVNAVMNLRVPWNAGNFLTSCKPVSFSRRTLHHGVSKYLVFNRIIFSFCSVCVYIYSECITRIICKQLIRTCIIKIFLLYDNALRVSANRASSGDAVTNMCEINHWIFMKTELFL